MEAMDRLIQGIKHVNGILAEEVMEPDLARDDWGGMRARIKLLSDAVQTDVLGELDAALLHADSPEIAPLIKRRVAALLGEASAPVYASGDAKTFLLLVCKAAELVHGTEHRDEYDAASSEPEVYCRLQHARWLRGRSRTRQADKLLGRVASETKQPALRRAAKKERDAPRPLAGAPPLFRLNGCGVGLYGARDTTPDGWYIATYCVCLLWIPIFPLGAYRVRRADESTYQFRAKEALGPVAKAFRALVLLGAAGAVAAGVITSYLESPSHRASVALEQAREAEASGDREGAIAQHKQLLHAYSGQTDVGPSAEAVVRLTAASVAEPCAATSVDQIGRVVTGFYDIPDAARAGAPAALLATRLAAWADQIGDGTPEQAHAALTVLDMASKVAEGGAEADAIEARRSKARRAFADKVASTRPLLSLDHYARLADAQALDAARAILETFGDAPSLWLEAEPQVTRYVDACKAQPGRGADAQAAQVRLAEARKVRGEDEALIEAGDEEAIARARATRPQDQELAVAVALARRGRGDVTGAIAELTALGAPGRMTASAQQLLGSCYSEAGDLAKADEVLSAFLAERLPGFQDAQREYNKASQAAQQRILSELRLGIAPRDLEAQMAGKTDAEQKEVFQSWFAERLNSDPSLSSLRAEYLRHVAVVPASLTLGTVKLRRAGDASGEARKALLGDAERTFLSIRQEAEGEPAFHLGLGQVYHRLGRAEDGNKELEGVLDRNDPALHLAVGRAYRELGLITRARQVVEEVYGAADDPDHKYAAASMMAHMADDLEDQETWLRRSDPSSPTIKNMLTNVAAGRLMREGKRAEADRMYAKVLAFHERGATRDPAAANNAAVACMSRYSATGDVAHLRAAAAHLETSVRLDPTNALVVGHLADVLEHIGLITTLDRWVQTRALMLESNGARGLLDALLDGPLRGEVLSALQRDATYRRSQEMGQQERILAPQKASAYRRRIRLLSWTRDGAGLGALAKQLEAMPAFSAEDAAAERRPWQAGERDEVFRRSTEQEVAEAEERLSRAQEGGSEPTVAAAWLAASDAYAARLYVEPGPEMAERTVAATRSALAAWPEGLTDAELAGSLVVAALYKAVAASPAVRKAWDADHRIYGTTMIVHRLITGAGGAEALSALREQPELAEAARIRRSRAGDRPQVSDWVLARAAGDAELEQAASKAFDREDLAMSMKIEVLLYPGQEREKSDLDLFQSEGR